MRLTLGTKAFLTIVLSTLTILTLTAAAVHWSFQRGLMDYVNDLRGARIERLAERLGEHYAREGSWAFLRDDPGALWALMQRNPRRPPNLERLRRRHERLANTLAPYDDPIGAVRGIAVLDADGRRIVGPPRPRGERYPILAGDATVGTLVVPPLRALSEAVDIDFARRQTRWLLTIFAAGIALAGLVAWVFARQLTRPVRALTDGTRALADGRYGETIAVTQRDELGRLAGDFNALSHTLARHREQRRALMADISHELRTPLSALRGQISALRDGVRAANAETLAALDAQVGRLNALVDELYELSLADSGALEYRMAPLDLRDVLRHVAELFAPRLEQTGIALELDLPEAPLPLQGDQRRLEQLFSNLLENTVRYTDAGGRARLAARAAPGIVTVTLDDTAPGVPDEALPHLFERLYRVEKSRSRALGGAGLGLALVTRIAQAHGGAASAAASPLGGLRVTVTLRAADD